VEKYLLAGVMIGFLVLAGGCSNVSKTIMKKSVSQTAEVFKEVEGAGEMNAGYADLVISASIKTHLEGHYPLESSASPHGKARYTFLLNIDGQASKWMVDGVKEDSPADGVGDKGGRDPEAGPGMKYVLNKRLRLAAGAHRVFFALPQENYAMEISIVLAGGREHRLEFMPEYRRTRHYGRTPSYSAGLRAFRVFLDDARVGPE
jgi:hypothetical protein